MKTTFDSLDPNNPQVDNSFINTVEYSEDYHLGYNETLSKLRQISQDTVRNHWVGMAAQQAYIDGIVGGSINFKVTCKNERDQAAVNSLIDFNRPIDETGTKTLVSLNEEMVAGAFSDGDILVNLTYSDEAAQYGTGVRVQLIEGSRIATRPIDRKNGDVINGVQFSKGKITGYWVKKEVQNTVFQLFFSDKDENYTFVPAYIDNRCVAYLFKAQTKPRPNMVRQYPVLTPVMNMVRYINSVLEAVLIGTRVAACFAGFVTSSNPVAAQKSMTDTIRSDSSDPLSTSTSNGSDRNAKITKLKPGMINYMRRGDSINFSSPNKPTDNFDALLVRIMRFVASALRIPYEVLMLDLSVTNFSAWRGGIGEQKRNIRRWRRELTAINTWIIQNILFDLLVRGKIKSAITKFEIRARFPQFESISPEEQARANKIRLANGTASKQMIAEEEDVDFDTLQQDIREEQELATRLEAERLVLIKELESQFDIEFPETIAAEKADGTNGADTSGDSGTNKTNEEDAKEKRKTDGNW